MVTYEFSSLKLLVRFLLPHPFYFVGGVMYYLKKSLAKVLRCAGRFLLFLASCLY